MELPVEMHDIEREALVDRLFAKWDAVFYALCETQRPPVDSPEPAQAVFDVVDGIGPD